MSLLNFHNSLPQIDLITIDLGNSHPHFCHFKKGEIESVSPIEGDIDSFLKELNTPFALCSVKKNYPSTFLPHIKEGYFYDMEVHYQKTLGHDRLIGSYYLFHALNEPFLFIDAGTFLTADFANASGLEGGFILPGLRTFLSSYKRGEQLQEDISEVHLSLFPSTTNEAISSGAALYKQGIIKELKALAQKRRIILTGGEADSFKEDLGNAECVPHLLHYALYFQYVKHKI